MITEEQAHGAAAAAFYKLQMPSHISLTVAGIDRAGQDMLVVTGIVGDNPEEPEFQFSVGLVNAEDLSEPAFGAWILGWAMATLGIVNRLDNDAAMLAANDSATKH